MSFPPRRAFAVHIDLPPYPVASMPSHHHARPATVPEDDGLPLDWVDRAAVLREQFATQGRPLHAWAETLLDHDADLHAAPIEIQLAWCRVRLDHLAAQASRRGHTSDLSGVDPERLGDALNGLTPSLAVALEVLPTGDLETFAYQTVIAAGQLEWQPDAVRESIDAFASRVVYATVARHLEEAKIAVSELLHGDQTIWIGDIEDCNAPGLEKRDDLLIGYQWNQLTTDQILATFSQCDTFIREDRRGALWTGVLHAGVREPARWVELLDYAGWRTQLMLKDASHKEALHTALAPLAASMGALRYALDVTPRPDLPIATYIRDIASWLRA